MHRGMRPRPVWVALAAVLAVCLLLVACGQRGGGDSQGAYGSSQGGGPEPRTASGGERPIRIGSTLPLTGVFSATGKIHHIAGQEFVKMLNEKGGLLGRPVEWVLLDDESLPDKAAALYERLITEEKVDLIIGPYGTASITARSQNGTATSFRSIHAA